VISKGRVKTESGLNLREKPNGKKVSVLRHNQEVEILDEVHFYRVKNGLGEIGYVHGDYLDKMPAVNSLSSVNATQSPVDQSTLSDAYMSVIFQNEFFIGEAVKIDRDFVSSLDRVGQYAKQSDVKIWVTSSTRNINTQVRGAIVPPASKSCHHIGHAIDMNVMHAGKLYNSKKLKRDNLTNLPSSINDFINRVRGDGVLRWGGDFNTEDPVHIDDNFYRREKVMYMAKLHSRVGQMNG